MSNDRDSVRAVVRMARFLGDNYRGLSPRTRKRVLRDVERELENLSDSGLAFGLRNDQPLPVRSVLVGTLGCTGPRPMGGGDCHGIERPSTPGTDVVRPDDLAQGVATMRGALDRLSVREGEALATDLAWILAQLVHQSEAPRSPGGESSELK